MKRGGLSNNSAVAWRHRNDAIRSFVLFVWWWKAHKFVRFKSIAVWSMIISIIIMVFRHWSLSGPALSDNIQSTTQGIVFPLYHYTYFQKDRAEMGGREMWYGGKGAIRRKIREESSLSLNILGGNASNHLDIGHFYIEMKLGFPPTSYHFHVDTGSGHTWVYCSPRNSRLKLTYWGPHGLFVPEEESYLKCIGETASLCEAAQNGIQPCNSDDEYLCIFSAHYADNSYYSGAFFQGNFTVPLQDKSEANVLGLLGCVVSKVLQGSEEVPLFTDGLIGLGNCKGTLIEHWLKSNVISHNVLAVCLAKALEQNTMISLASPRGFISLGNDYNEQFSRNSVWSKLVDDRSSVLCGCAAKLLSISFHDKALVFSSRFARQPIGISLLFDTGSDMTYFDAVIYNPLLKTLADYATLRGYIRVEDNDKYVVNEQRLCWEPSRKKLAGGSPIQDFQPLAFAFEGIPSIMDPAPLQYLVVHPENYLSWDAQVKKLCVNILQDNSVGTSVSNLGADMMRDHLFIFDYEKQRVRWQSNSCGL